VIFFLNGKIKNQKSLVKDSKSKISTLEVILNQNQKSQELFKITISNQMILNHSQHCK